jgi:ankyrin repeat protein
MAILDQGCVFVFIFYSVRSQKNNSKNKWVSQKCVLSTCTSNYNFLVHFTATRAALEAAKVRAIARLRSGTQPPAWQTALVCELQHMKQVFPLNVHAMFRDAAKCGNFKLFEALLQHPRTTHDMCRIAFFDAVEHGHAQIVTLLLQIAPMHLFHLGDFHLAIQLASEYGHSNVVALLLQDSRNGSLPNNFAVLIASAHGHADVVALLLQDADPTVLDMDCIVVACSAGHTDIVALLLADGRINPAVRNNMAIRLASQFGHLGVVAMLLADPRVDPTADDNCAIRMAHENGHEGVVDLLREDGRVVSTTTRAYSIVRLASAADVQAARDLPVFDADGCAATDAISGCDFIPGDTAFILDASTSTPVSLATLEALFVNNATNPFYNKNPFTNVALGAVTKVRMVSVPLAGKKRVRTSKH